MKHTRTLVAGILALCYFAGGGLAQAAHSSINGKLAFAEETEDAPAEPRVMTVDPFVAAQPALLDLFTSFNPAPDWSPDGRRIAFARASDVIELRNVDIWTVDFNLGDLTQVTVTPDVDEQEPTWSPDGSSIAYTVYDSGTGSSAIWKLDIATRVAIRLSPAGVDDTEPSWSPVGNRIAFSRDVNDSRQIFVMDASPGAVATRLTSVPGNNDSPSWSPDGRQIAWSNSPKAAQYSIWKMRDNGRAARRLTNDLDFHPTWSPDGRFIAFDRGDRTTPFWSRSLWYMGTNGGKQTHLMFNSREVRGQWPEWGRKPAAGA